MDIKKSIITKIFYNEFFENKKMYYIIVNVKDYENNNVSYSIKGNTITKPEINDICIISNYKIKHDNEYNKDTYICNYIKIQLPIDDIYITKRLYNIYETELKKNQITIKEIKSLVSKYKNDVWNINVKLISYIIDKNIDSLIDDLCVYLNTINIKLSIDKIELIINIFDNDNDNENIKNIYEKNKNLYQSKKEILFYSIQEIINTIPWILLTIKGININIIQDIINSLKLSKDDKCKFNIMLDIYDFCYNKGHMCLPKKVINIEYNKFIDELVKQKYLYLYSDYIYIYHLYQIENNLSEICKIKINNINEKLNYNSSLTEEQNKAIENALKYSLSCINGAPGTGKTTCIYGIIEMLMNNKNNAKIALLAPTGKALNRIKESLKNIKYFDKLDFFTIHKFIHLANNKKIIDNENINNETNYDIYYKYDIDKFKFDNSKLYNTIICEDININYDLIIIDECSMIDSKLFYDFFNIKNLSINILLNANIVLLGDTSQLPSIGPGDVFKIYLKTNIIPKITLTKIHRQNESNLLTLITNIQNNKLPEFQNNDDTYFFENKNNEDEISNEINNLLIKYQNNLDNLIFLAPTYKIIDKYQNIIRKYMNINYNNETNNKLLEGDIIMYTKNNYNLGLFNGMIGKIIHIYESFTIYKFNNYLLINEQKLKKLLINDSYKYKNYIIKKIGTDKYLIDDIYTEYNKIIIPQRYLIFFDDDKFHNVCKNDLYNNYQLAYINTIHKIQGSEKDIVVLIIENSNFINKQLLYTGISRAKKCCYIIGSEKNYKNAINNKCNIRYTNLYKMIQEKKLIF